MIEKMLGLGLYFHYIGNMEIFEATESLGALAHETRLEIFRYLIRKGPQGEAVGVIGDVFDLPGATLSFHLRNLKQANLIKVQREGRSLIYSPNFDHINATLAFLVEDCCQGNFDASSCAGGQCQ
ncbi:MAG: helix-turn-helix domain-containing protein [Pseudomonadales bacterium]|nr:helix-turn-helix domain-containing protein [Pseudomonadales bacterium]